MLRRIIPAITYIFSGKLPEENQHLLQMPNLIVTQLSEAIENLKKKNLKGASDIMFYVMHEMNRKHSHLLSHFLKDRYFQLLKRFNSSL